MSETKLSRVLGNRDTIALAFGAMIGWGWIVLAGSWVQNAGAMGAITAFVIGGIIVTLIGLTYAELAAAMPFVGGEHVYSFRALGAFASFICTWSIILGYVSVVAFEAVSLPTVLEYLFPDYQKAFIAEPIWNVAGWDVYFTWVLVGIGGSVFMTILNYFGVKTAAVFQTVVTVAILAIGIMFLSGALTNGSTGNLDPLFVSGEGKGIIAVLIMVPFMFVGFDVIPQAAEEIKLPFKQIGRILVISVLMAVVWYIGIILAVSLSLDAEGVAGANLVTADAMAAVFNGSWAGKVMVIAGIAGIITSWNAFFVGGSRAIYAMAKSNMLPKFLGNLHPKYKTPYNAIILIGVLSCIAPLFGRKALIWLVDAGGLGIVIAYAFVALSFLVLRAKEPNMPRPFMVSYGNLVGYTALIASIGLGLMYLPMSPAALTPEEWYIFAGWMGLGFVLYLWARIAYGEPVHVEQIALEQS